MEVPPLLFRNSQHGCISSVTAAGRVSALLLLPKAAGSCVLTSLAVCAGAARPLCRDYVITDPPLPSFFHSAQPVDFGRHVRLRMRGRLCFSWMRSSSFQQVKWLTASGLKSQWRRCVYVCVVRGCSAVRSLLQHCWRKKFSCVCCCFYCCCRRRRHHHHVRMMQLQFPSLSSRQLNVCEKGRERVRGMSLNEAQPGCLPCRVGGC